MSSRKRQRTTTTTTVINGGRYGRYSRSAPHWRRAYMAARKAAIRRRQPRTPFRSYTLNARTGGFLGIATKYLDEERTAYNITDSVSGSEADPSTVNCLNAIAVGTSESQRDGKSVFNISLHVRGVIQASPGDDAYQPSTAMIAIICDKQTNGAQFNSEDVFQEVTTSSLAPFCFRNLEYINRFKVLYRKIFNYFATASTHDGTNTKNWVKQIPFEINIPLGFTTNYKSDTPSVADIIDNSLHVVAMCTHNSVIDLKYESRLRFRG